MSDNSKPFWEREYTPLDIALNPFSCVESSVELTPQEKANLKSNLSFEGIIPAVDWKKPEYFTIYTPAEVEAAGHLENAKVFIPKLITLEEDYIKNGGCKLIKRSIYRSMDHHLRIYKAKGITDPKKIPMKSWHLVFLGADLVPAKMPIGHFHKYLVANDEAKLKQFKLFMEHEKHTPTWAHVQDRPYGSFKPGMSHRYHI